MTEQKTTLKNFIERLLGSKVLVLVYLLVAAASMILLAAVQPFGDPPDEMNRFKVVYFIANHGFLPNGYDEEVILGGYGGSYAFQPILPYIIMGYLLRIIKTFTVDSFTLIFAARMVNVCCGVLMAYYVWRIGKKLFDEVAVQWLFTLMIVFLPMNLFMHSYVNTDSMALLSAAVIIYSMLLGEEDDYSKKTCIRMAIGVILCAMSYYNAYGIVLCAMLFFFYHFAVRKQWKSMFQKGGLIAALVLIGAGWWFVRNGILYNGDLFGMTARTDCAIQTALPEYNPLTRHTFYGDGLPISAVFAEKQYAWVTFESMIAMFGPMSIPTHGLIYLYYKRLVIFAALCMLIPLESRQPLMWQNRKPEGSLQMLFGKKKAELTPRLAFGLLMLLDCLITMGLHLYYSYTWEYQPQGRYLLPMLISAVYLLTMGIWKLNQVLEIGFEKMRQASETKEAAKSEAKKKWNVWYLQFAIILFIVMFVGATYAYTIFIKVIPVYRNINDLSMLKGVPFEQLVDLFFGRM